MDAESTSDLADPELFHRWVPNARSILAVRRKKASAMPSCLQDMFQSLSHHTVRMVPPAVLFAILGDGRAQRGGIGIDTGGIDGGVMVIKVLLRN